MSEDKKMDVENADNDLREETAEAAPEVAEHDRLPRLLQLQRRDRAAGAAEVGVHDDEVVRRGRGVAADVVVVPERRNGSAGEIAHARQTVLE